MLPEFNYEAIFKMRAPQFLSYESTLDPDTLDNWNKNIKPELQVSGGGENQRNI
jgi:hypothetical protein